MIIWKVLIPIFINFSFSARSNEQGNVFDYLIQTEAKTSNLYSMVQYERDDEETFQSHEFAVFEEQEYWIAKLAWQRYEQIDLQLYQIDVRGKYKGWNTGVMQMWEDQIPSTNFVMGKVFHWNFNFFILPGSLDYTQDFITDNFQNWNYETHAMLKFRNEMQSVETLWNLISENDIRIPMVNVHLKYDAKDYGTVIWQFLVGIGVDY